MREIDIAKARLACRRAMTRPVYLQHRTYLVTVGMAESCQIETLSTLDRASGMGALALDLCLLGLGHSEFVKSLLEIVEKGLPLDCSDHEMLVRVLHGTARVLLRPAGRPAKHFCDEILEAWRGNTMMGLVYP